MTLQRLPFRAMGSRMEALLDSPTPAAAEALTDVPRWFEEWEQILSRFRAGSELTRLNARAGQPVRVSPVLWEVLRAALSAERVSEGLVAPTLLNELEAAGYDRSFEALPSFIAPGPDDVAVTGCAVRLEPRSHSVTVPEGVRLDLGGIAKGWAADQAATRLQAYGPALVNAGGDIALSGPRADGSAWPIGVTDPFDAGAHIEVLQVPRGGIATSGRDYHRWRQGGIERHHILDPRTGRPAESDVLTATVLAPSAEQAEAAAKTALILGSCAGLAWLNARPRFAGLLVLESGQVLRSRRLHQYRYLD
jgi:thiamine biosynthesis lipoprotein